MRGIFRIIQSRGKKGEPFALSDLHFAHGLLPRSHSDAIRDNVVWRIGAGQNSGAFLCFVEAEHAHRGCRKAVVYAIDALSAQIDPRRCPEQS
jgi:hypothetical protein